MIYLDHNATTPVRPEARDAVIAALSETGNASSIHMAGRAARRRIEDAREVVGRFIGARAQDVVFTSGGTEANNQALRGCGRARQIVSAIEHDSVLAAAGPDADILPVDGNGVVDLERLAAMLAERGEDTVVSVMRTMKPGYFSRSVMLSGWLMMRVRWSMWTPFRRSERWLSVLLKPVLT